MQTPTPLENTRKQVRRAGSSPHERRFRCSPAARLLCIFTMHRMQKLYQKGLELMSIPGPKTPGIATDVFGDGGQQTSVYWESLRRDRNVPPWSEQCPWEHKVVLSLCTVCRCCVLTAMEMGARAQQRFGELRADPLCVQEILGL